MKSENQLKIEGETVEQVQEKVNLTAKQKKAWAQLVRAVNKCKEENILFYQVLETLMGLNGNEVIAVENAEYVGHSVYSHRALVVAVAPHVGIDMGGSSFADDVHVVRFHGEFL